MSGTEIVHTPGHAIGRHRPFGALHTAPRAERRQSVPCRICRRRCWTPERLCDNEQCLLRAQREDERLTIAKTSAAKGDTERLHGAAAGVLGTVGSVPTPAPPSPKARGPRIPPS